MQSSGAWLWAGFFLLVSFLMGVDIIFMHRRKARIQNMRAAFMWCLILISSALIFNFLLWKYFLYLFNPVYAKQKALEFFSGYLIELSLSMDNMFVFIMIFNFFGIPSHLQHRVLIYGIISAIVMRFCMIFFGTWLVQELHWILYVFGVFLIITGIKMLFLTQDKNALAHNRLLIFLKKHLRLTPTLHGEHFFIRKASYYYATPLFLVLIIIEVSDLMFALDSIPAIFSVTQDTFIIFTSNIFAILGLRALYFLLAHTAERFYLLRYGIAILLSFVGFKMLLAAWFEIPILYTLSIIVLILGLTIIFSLLKPNRTIP